MSLKIFIRVFFILFILHLDQIQPTDKFVISNVVPSTFQYPTLYYSVSLNDEETCCVSPKPLPPGAFVCPP